MAAFTMAVAQAGAVRPGPSIPANRASGLRQGARCFPGVQDGRLTVFATLAGIGCAVKGGSRGARAPAVSRGVESTMVKEVHEVQSTDTDVHQQVALALTNKVPTSIISRDVVAKLQTAIAEAKAFFEKADDGLRPQLFQEADVVLVGPSRTGKTTLASFLAKLGLKVANYPLVPGEDPPGQLFDVDAKKIALLTTDAKQLQSIRQERMLRLGRASSRYATLGKIQDELDWVRMFYMKKFPRFPVVNTARVGIAEAAALILSHLYGRQVGEEATTQLVDLISMLTHGAQI